MVVTEKSAGGVVYRRTAGGVEMLLIRDRFGRITLPKGKEEPGETPEQTAVREIAEETGIEARVETLLDVTRYEYGKADGTRVEKTVRYYLLEAVGGELRAQREEIGDARWVTPGEAIRLQQAAGYPNNQAVFRKALELLGMPHERP